jgi:hypothetical protein
LSHLRGELVVSKQDSDRGLLNLTVGTPFTIDFDGKID